MNSNGYFIFLCVCVCYKFSIFLEFGLAVHNNQLTVVGDATVYLTNEIGVFYLGRGRQLPVSSLLVRSLFNYSWKSTPYIYISDKKKYFFFYCSYFYEGHKIRTWGILKVFNVSAQRLDKMNFSLGTLKDMKLQSLSLSLFSKNCRFSVDRGFFKKKKKRTAEKYILHKICGWGGGCCYEVFMKA